MDHIKFHDQEEEPFSLKVRSGEIAVIRDNDYKTASRPANRDGKKEKSALTEKKQRREF